VTDYPFGMQLAVAPLDENNIIRDGEVWIFEPSDANGVSPLALTDLSGLPMTNPLRSNAFGNTRPFITTVPQVKWKSGVHEGLFDSFKGMFDEAAAAKLAAQDAAVNAADGAAAELALRIEAGEFQGPPGPLTDIVIGTVETVAGNPLDDDIISSEIEFGTKTKAVLSATYAQTLVGGKGVVRKDDQVIDVRDYGAVGNGTANDSPGFQAAVNAALTLGRDLLIPAPPNFWRLESTILIEPQSNGRRALNIRASGIYSSIRWYGANDSAVFLVHGLQDSIIRNVKVDIPAGKSGITAWDLDCTFAFSALSRVTFENCFVGLNTGINNIGYRIGHISEGPSDISFIQWSNCFVNGGGDTSANTIAGQRGWIIEGGNTLNMVWVGGFGAMLEKMITNKRDGTGNGGQSIFVYGLGGGYNGTDYEFAAIGSALISGGRFELGKRFLNVTGPAANHTVVTMQNLEIRNYRPADEILAKFDRPGTLAVENCWIFRDVPNTDHTAAMFTMGGFTGRGSLTISGGAIRSIDYPVTASTDRWDVTLRAVAKLGADTNSLTHLPNRSGRLSWHRTATYGATVQVDTGTGSSFTINATDANAFTIANPLNPSIGQVLTFQIRNGTGAALGAITWGSAFAIAGPFVTSTANGTSRTVTFRYDGSRWLETGRSAGDLPA
jgi:hypothetical protein